MHPWGEKPYTLGCVPGERNSQLERVPGQGKKKPHLAQLLLRRWIHLRAHHALEQHGKLPIARLQLLHAGLPLMVLSASIYGCEGAKRHSLTLSPS
jgi:hypothetical protein